MDFASFLYLFKNKAPKTPIKSPTGFTGKVFGVPKRGRSQKHANERKRAQMSAKEREV